MSDDGLLDFVLVLYLRVWSLDIFWPDLQKTYFIFGFVLPFWYHYAAG